MGYTISVTKAKQTLRKLFGDPACGGFAPLYFAVKYCEIFVPQNFDYV
jgi:hypothetical protein